MPEKKQSFTVQLQLCLKAKDMDEALAEAKKLVIGDFVTIKSDFFDQSMELTGIVVHFPNFHGALPFHS